MPLDPLGQGVPSDCATRYSKHDTLCIVGCGPEFEPIQDQEGLDRGVPYPLVAIDEWMVLDQRKADGARLRRQSGIKIDSAACHSGLRNGTLECPQVANRSGAASLATKAAMEFQYLTEGEVPHSGKPAVEVLILRQHVRSGPLEIIGGSGEKIADRGGCQIPNWDIQAPSRLSELALGVAGQVEGDSHEGNLDGGLTRSQPGGGLT